MVTLLIGIVGLLSAGFAWWISPQQRKSRLENELESVRNQIREVTSESDHALTSHNGDRLTQCDAELHELRQHEADLLQRFAKDFPNG